MQRLRVFQNLSIGFALGLAGCVQIYKSPTPADGHVATIMGSKLDDNVSVFVHGSAVYVISVDGIYANSYSGAMWAGINPVVLTPGMHVLNIGVVSGFYGGETAISGDFKTGQTYTLEMTHPTGALSFVSILNQDGKIILPKLAVKLHNLSGGGAALLWEPTNHH